MKRGRFGSAAQRRAVFAKMRRGRGKARKYTYSKNLTYTKKDVASAKAAGKPTLEQLLRQRS